MSALLDFLFWTVLTVLTLAVLLRITFTYPDDDE